MNAPARFSSEHHAGGRTRRVWPLLAAGLLLLAGALPRALAADGYDAALAAWGRVLERFVDAEGRIDFALLARERDDLLTFVTAVARTGPRSAPGRFGDRDAALAFHLNAYNALAMHGVIEAGIPTGFNGFFRRAAFFRFRAITVDGTETNLYDYENDVIRPLGDARIHFALNCMVRDCPRLPRVPFDSHRIDAQLDAAAREFINSRKHVRRDVPDRTVWLSAIFDFYTEDFAPGGERQELIPYVNRYVEEPVPAGFRVRFMDYDWTVNAQPPGGGAR